MDKCDHLHIVAFQNPYPPTYGGVIDVFYRIKALKDAGYRITLHTYTYGDRTEIKPDLKSLVSEIHTYKRPRNILRQFSSLPYIVNTRRDKQLLHNLCSDNAPILFEGLHTCFFLNHPALKGRIKIVRMHNIEHDYYTGLAKASTNLYKRLFYSLEAKRLHRFEAILNHADIIAAISSTEMGYFEHTYGKGKTILLPPFFDDSMLSLPVAEKSPFVLFNGNLGVSENDIAACWIVEHVASLLPSTKFVIAGANPSDRLQSLVRSYHNVELRANPDINEMNNLIETAKVSLLITFQPTGVKLKLLSALMSGAHVIANPTMLEGTPFSAMCTIASSADEMARCIEEKMKAEPRRSRNIPLEFLPHESIKSLITKI